MKHISIVGLVSMLLASAAFGVGIGNFEGSFDGWEPQGGAVFTNSATGATVGASSLRAAVPAGGGWKTILKLQMQNDPLKSQLKANDTLSFDLTWLTSDWTGPGTWAKVEAAIVNGEGVGWNQKGLTAAGDPANPSYPGSWDPGNWGAQHTRHLTFDLSGINYSSLDSLGRDPYWLELLVAVNYDAAFTNGAYYIDNIQLTPEPATMALLGLGGLALLRRRRMA